MTDNPYLKSRQEIHPLPKSKLKTLLKLHFSKNMSTTIKKVLDENMDDDRVIMFVDPVTNGGRIFFERTLNEEGTETEQVCDDLHPKQRTGYRNKYHNAWRYKSIYLPVAGQTKQKVSNQIDKYLDDGQGRFYFAYDYNTRKWHTGYALKYEVYKKQKEEK